MTLSRVHRFLAMLTLGAVDDLLKDLQLLGVSLAEILSHRLAGQEAANVDHQFQQVGRVLPVQSRVEVLLLLGLFELLEQIVLLVLRAGPRRAGAVCLGSLGDWRL